MPKASANSELRLVKPAEIIPAQSQVQFALSGPGHLAAPAPTGAILARTLEWLLNRRAAEPREP